MFFLLVKIYLFVFISSRRYERIQGGSCWFFLKISRHCHTSLMPFPVILFEDRNWASSSFGGPMRLNSRKECNKVCWPGGKMEHQTISWGRGASGFPASSLWQMITRLEITGLCRSKAVLKLGMAACWLWLRGYDTKGCCWLSTCSARSTI